MTMFTNKKEIAAWLNERKIENYYILPDLSVDVQGNVNIGAIDLNYLPVQFNHVEGHFSCTLTVLPSLRGSPRSVRGSFTCSGNRLTTLEFCPEFVGDIFIMNNNLKLGDFQNINDFSIIKAEHQRIRTVLAEQQKLNELMSGNSQYQGHVFKL